MYNLHPKTERSGINLTNIAIAQTIASALGSYQETIS